MSDPTDELTLTQAIDALREQGFVTDFAVAPGGQVRCSACGHLHPASAVVVVATLRVEGVSDPDDEAAAFGVRCSECQAPGVLVVSYGPSSSAEDVAVVTELRDAGTS